MSTHSLSANSAHDSSLRIHFFGHESAHPAEIAHRFGGLSDQDPTSDCDLAVFVVNPTTGIDAVTIAAWETLNESMVPRLIIIVLAEESEADFDDAVMICNRVFDQTVTPFLVLHDDEGLPCALIDLFTQKIIDYSTNPPTISESESEHKTLVSEFRDEYLQALEVQGDDAFAAGLLFPAIPLTLNSPIGADIIESYIARLK
ncbi:MAG: hypothetical protein D4R83_03650 [Streptomycetaceae bacterium]|nr:MAG: hypothetical protein D4R83_03650 [Streptomycetaceae bacterium]